MRFRRVLRFVKRTLQEIFFDLHSGDFAKPLHLLKCIYLHFTKGYPYAISIEPINACDLRCEFCSAPPWELQRPKRAVTIDEFKKIVDDVKGFTHYLFLYLSGEPFLNPHLPEMIAYATKNNLHVTVSTNFNALSEQHISDVVSAKLDHLILSVDGASKETYEQMRKGGNFEKVVSNIKTLMAEKKRRASVKPFVEMQMLVSKINEHEQQAYLDMAKDLGSDKVWLKTLAIPTWVYDEKKSKSIAETYLPILNGPRRYEGNGETLQVKRFGLCGFHRKSMVLADGTVTMCCYDIQGKYSFGNTLQQNFKEIWQSDKYTKGRETIKQRAFPICQTCAETDDVF